MQTLAEFGRLTSPPELRSDVGGSKQRERKGAWFEKLLKY